MRAGGGGNKLVHRQFLGGGREEGGKVREGDPQVYFPGGLQLPRNAAGALQAQMGSLPAHLVRTGFLQLCFLQLPVTWDKGTWPGKLESICWALKSLFEIRF